MATSSFLMFPGGKPQDKPVGFEDITNTLGGISLDSESTTSEGNSKFTYVRGPPNKLGFRTRRPVPIIAEGENPSQASSDRTTSSDYVLPDFPELSSPEARQKRMARLAQEAKAREESERLYVSLGGTLLDSQGRRDLVRTAAIREDLKKEEERKRIEREKLEKKKAVESAWECYESRWSNLLSLSPGTNDKVQIELTYEDIPWPVFGSCKCHSGPADLDKELRPMPSFSEARNGQNSSQSMQVDADDVSTPSPNPYLNPRTTAAFLFHLLRPNQEISRRDMIQKCFLRWHPDKFNYRVLNRVCDRDREAVKMDASRVVQILADWKEESG